MYITEQTTALPSHLLIGHTIIRRKVGARQIEHVKLFITAAVAQIKR